MHERATGGAGDTNVIIAFGQPAGESDDVALGPSHLQRVGDDQDRRQRLHPQETPSSTRAAGTGADSGPFPSDTGCARRPTASSPRNTIPNRSLGRLRTRT